MSRLTKEEVFRAVVKAVRPESLYIGDEVRKTKRGMSGFPVSNKLVLARLNDLEKEGLLTRNDYPHGYYGYTWSFTDAGKAAAEKEKVA